MCKGVIPMSNKPLRVREKGALLRPPPAAKPARAGPLARLKEAMRRPRLRRAATQVGLCLCLLGLCAAYTLSLGDNATAVVAGKRELPIYSVERDDKVLAISFDASWGADKTISSLDILDEHDVKTTFFLVGGCDGARPGRNYFTEFVKQAPKDTVILTLACGKYRFNDLDLGTIGGLPRLMDIGQCNDAYSAIRITQALADAFGCGVNELPLSMVLSWYEQKAVCILLTLLSLGIKNIRLGPTLPAFLSPNVLKLLAETYGIAPVTTPEADLKELLGG